jgi:hypothetical protein
VIFRRRDKATNSTGETAQPKTHDTSADTAAPVDPSTLDPSVTGEEYRRLAGPWDIAERPVDGTEPRSIDLGSIVVKGRPGFELRLQTDKETEAVQALMLVAQDGAVELRAFAKPRGAGLWDDVRKEIAADAARRGGTATEIEGRYGTELRVVAQVQTPDGQRGTQTSRIVGVDGPRWLLRATYLGRPATETDQDHLLEAAVRDLVIARGQEAMPPRELLPLRLPPTARRAE